MTGHTHTQGWTKNIEIVKAAYLFPEAIQKPQNFKVYMTFMLDTENRRQTQKRYSQRFWQTLTKARFVKLKFQTNTTNVKPTETHAQ